MRLTDLPAGTWSGAGHLNRGHEAVYAPPHPNGLAKASHFDLDINWDGLTGDTKGIYGLFRGCAYKPPWAQTRSTQRKSGYRVNGKMNGHTAHKNELAATRGPCAIYLRDISRLFVQGSDAQTIDMLRR